MILGGREIIGSNLSKNGFYRLTKPFATRTPKIWKRSEASCKKSARTFSSGGKKWLAAWKNRGKFRRKNRNFLGGCPSTAKFGLILKKNSKTNKRSFLWGLRLRRPPPFGRRVGWSRMQKQGQKRREEKLRSYSPPRIDFSSNKAPLLLAFIYSHLLRGIVWWNIQRRIHICVIR